MTHFLRNVDAGDSRESSPTGYAVHFQNVQSSVGSVNQIDTGEPVLATQTTAAGGAYDFTGLVAGSYLIDDAVQFERLGYFCPDAQDDAADARVFNRIVTLRDSWAKLEKQALQDQAE